MIFIVEKIKSILTDQSRKGTLVFWGYSAAALAALFVLVFLPLKVRFHHASAALAARQTETNLIKASGISQLSDHELAELQRKAALFKSSFIKASQLAGALNHVSDQAEKNHLKVLDVNVDQMMPLKDESGEDFRINGVKYSRMPVHIHLETRYKALANFLRALEQVTSNIYVVDSFKLKLNSAKSDILDCQLTISFFLANA